VLTIRYMALFALSIMCGVSCGCGCDAGQVHVNDVGTVFRLVIRDESNFDCATQCEPPAADLSAAGTTVAFEFKRPDGSVVSVPAVPTPVPLGTGTGSDGRFQVTATSMSPGLTQVGLWRFRAVASVPSVSVFRTSWDCFHVSE
jgi:hypothetical protein